MHVLAGEAVRVKPRWMILSVWVGTSQRYVGLRGGGDRRGQRTVKYACKMFFVASI